MILHYHSDIVNDKSQMMKDTVEKIAKLMGPTRNYGMICIWFLYNYYKFMKQFKNQHFHYSRFVKY